MNPRFFPDPAALALAAASEVAGCAASAVRQRGRFSLALAGGSTPLAAYRLLGRPPLAGEIEWPRVHLFWGDERCVPWDHEDNNARAALEALGKPPGLEENHIHPIPGEAGPKAGAEAYARELESFFGGSGPPVLDLILLGLGPDGHVASLFPGDPALGEQKRWVVGVAAPGRVRPHTARISLSLPVINAARKVLLLISGKGKEEATRALLETPAAPPHTPPDKTLPASLIRPAGGLEVFVDRTAMG